METDFGWTIEADGDVAATGSGGSVALKGVPLPAAGEDMRGNSLHADDIAALGQTDLTGMGMAGEEEVVGEVGRDGGDLGAVGQEDSGEIAG